MCSKEEAYDNFNGLDERVKALDNAVWSRKGYYNKMTLSTDLKAKFEKGGEKPEALTKFVDSLIKLEEQVTKAEKEQAEWHQSRDELADLIRSYKECLNAEDYPSHKGNLKTSVASIDKLLTKNEMDADSYQLQKYMGPTSVKELRDKLAGFVKKVNDIKAAPQWKSMGVDKAKALRFIKATEETMKKVQPLLTRDKKQDQVERITSLLRDLKDACNRDEDEMDIGEAHFRVGIIKKDYPEVFQTAKKPSTPNKSPKSSTSSKSSKGVEDQEEVEEKVPKSKQAWKNDDALQERIKEYQVKAAIYGHVANDLQTKEFEKGLTLYDIKKHEGLESDPDTDGFKVVKTSIRQDFDDAYEALERCKGKQPQLGTFIKALERAEAFFAKLDLPESEDESSSEPSGNEGDFINDGDEMEDASSSSGSEDSDEEEEEEEDSSSDSEEVVPKNGRKRSRDSDGDEEMANVIKAMDLAEPDERKRLRSLYENREMELFGELVSAVNLRHLKHYEIILARPDGSPDINNHLMHFLRISNSHICNSRQQAEERVKLYKLDEIPNLNYRIEEIAPQ